ncbi:Eco57I restriction-modification methylase domain-containing protein [Nocardioides bigeumensis]|uniref:Eco57I restriction-modification methylase domain-containing protein n=1 Tax=Nocardioides bigeumensis TaxID=433657 RepID=UPI003CD085B3
MTKKFDVVIGNPPYQEEAQGGGTRDTPITTCLWTPRTRWATRLCSSRPRAFYSTQASRRRRGTRRCWRTCT